MFVAYQYCLLTLYVDFATQKLYTLFVRISSRITSLARGRHSSCPRESSNLSAAVWFLFVYILEESNSRRLQQPTNMYLNGNVISDTEHISHFLNDVIVHRQECYFRFHFHVNLH